MPDKMTKLKKSKQPKEREPDEVKARGEEKEKKQKKRHSQQPPPSAPPWIWWLAGGPNQRKKRTSHKSSKEKSSSKKHSTKERSTDKKKKTTTTTTRRKKHREDESENEDDIDETNSAAGDLGVDDGENDYEMMLGQAKQINKNHTWIDEHHSSVGSDRTNYPMPPRDRTPIQSSGDTGFTRTNGERELATRHQGGHPQASRRQDDFQSPTVQDDDETTNRRNISQASPTSIAHQQSSAPQNDFTATSQENGTDNIDADHGTLPTIQEEPPKFTSHQSNPKHTEQEQNTTTAGRDTATSSGDGCGVTDMWGDKQESKESASPPAGEDKSKIPESTNTTSKKGEDLQVKEQAIESNGSQENQQQPQESDESRVNENESTVSGQSSSCTVT
ncbi:hypothetical protein NCS56_00722500 [Fusarium sp. Ph1]|nr:hypothetical protein NCS56_00722500 [Fusarium sp. Ph1]